jgi:predicted small lipoprotein YifL
MKNSLAAPLRWFALPLLLALAACGQKGNLYLPDEGVTSVPVSTPPANDADADTPEK